ncbi:uncharacterized protein LOC127832078 isoform X2 [Dreissena polymorpha]|nr:uncharacterized protein LOC127832078 isoform X2 [Dreissena polymorpha]XP_052213203.1 uncharacterized protein LOC127832078 isoform X2 [Dreissena polymorpha]XP_052213204.1 uncharacterized protein LOC127832078 isoform X2 [Dreissena polymorpha]
MAQYLQNCTLLQSALPSSSPTVVQNNEEGNEDEAARLNDSTPAGHAQVVVQTSTLLPGPSLLAHIPSPSSPDNSHQNTEPQVPNPPSIYGVVFMPNEVQRSELIFYPPKFQTPSDVHVHSNQNNKHTKHNVANVPNSSDLSIMQAGCTPSVESQGWMNSNLQTSLFLSYDAGQSVREQHQSDNEYYLRQNVSRAQSGLQEIKLLCDAVIVYDQNDFDYAVDMRDEIQAIVRTEVDEPLRIKLFDDREFMQSTVQNVQDILKNASVVLVYLSNYTENSRQVQLFITEAVALASVSLTNQNPLGSGCIFSVWPVHSQPPNRRNYRTPAGLVSISGIDWYNRTSRYTHTRIVELMTNSIRRRGLIEHQSRKELRQTTLQIPFTHEQYHISDAPKHAWTADASAFTTPGALNVPTDFTEHMHGGRNHFTNEYDFNVNNTESLMRPMRFEPNQGSAGSSYAQGGEQFSPMGEYYIQPADDRQRPTTSVTNIRAAHGYCATNQMQSAMQNAPIQFQLRPPQNSPGPHWPQHPQQQLQGRMTMSGGDRTPAPLRQNTQQHTQQQTGSQKTIVIGDRTSEYSSGPSRHKKQQQQRIQKTIHRGDRTSMQFVSNQSTKDVEIVKPTRTEGAVGTYHQGPVDSVYQGDPDSSEDEMFAGHGNLPGSKGGRILNIVGSKVLQIGNENRVSNVRNIVKKDRKQTQGKKTRLTDKERCNTVQKTYSGCGKPAKGGVSGYELNIPLQEPQRHARTDVQGAGNVRKDISVENTELTAPVSYSDLRNSSHSPK